MEKVRFIWSKSDAGDELHPFCIVECDKEIANEIINRFNRGDYEGGWYLLADFLHEKYPKKFPTWWDEYDRRRLFWYNNVLESFNAAYERMVEERMKWLSDYYDDEESLREAAEWRVDEKLEKLPVYVIE